MAVAPLAWALACGGFPTDPFPSDAVRYVPPGEYGAYWAEVENCAGLTGDLSKITWYAVPDSVIVVQGDVYDGYWFRDGDRILLTPDGRSSVGIIEHEMLHALLQRSDHPCLYFVTRCGQHVQQPPSCT